MPPPDAARIRRVRSAILGWYGRHERELVWRTTTDAYEILVSEIMLQQTQVARVQQKFPAFLRSFPTLRRLAGAARSDVLRAWTGMGYNNRAVRLHELARTVVERHGGALPDTLEELRALPGIGRYTAHALLCFARGRRIPVVDVNIRRVLSRIFWKMPDAGALRPEESIWEFAELVLPRDASRWNQALMDLGATICLARTPACDRCPVSALCRSAHPPRPRTTRPRHAATAEPSRAGIPRRIWRGRMIERLRAIPRGRFMTLRALAGAVKPDLGPSDLLWFASLVRALERDGLVTLRRRGTSCSVRLADR